MSKKPIEGKIVDVTEEDLENFLKEMNEQEEKDVRVEEESGLVYDDGQKVLRGDLVKDLGEEARYEAEMKEHGKANTFGFHGIITRIYEEGTVDFCVNGNEALKMFEIPFEEREFKLIERGQPTHSPMDDLFGELF